MKTRIVLFSTVLVFALPTLLLAEDGRSSELSIEKIMQGEKFVGSLPSGEYWSEDGKQIYFRWNPEFSDGDSLYVISPSGGQAKKVSADEIMSMPNSRGSYNKARTLKVYSKNGDLFILDIRSGSIEQITNTSERESSPEFTGDETGVVFGKGKNLFVWEIESGKLLQLTDFKKGEEEGDDDEPKNASDRWLKAQERRLSSVLEGQLSKADRAKKIREGREPVRPLEIYVDGKRVSNKIVSPDMRFVTFRLVKDAKGAQRTIVPKYFTESGYTEDIDARTNVGAPQSTQEFGIYDRVRDTVYYLSVDSLPGIYDVPAYLADYATESDTTESDTTESDTTETEEKAKARKVAYHGPYWSRDGKYAVMVILAHDKKDRWIVKLDAENAKVTLLDRQHDDAWVGGPGIAWGVYWAGTVGFSPDGRQFWFSSEETGYAHLYSVNVSTGKKTAVTSGDFEVDRVVLSHDGERFYFIANVDHPGDWQVYSVSSKGGALAALTSKPGRYSFSLSPNEKKLLLRYSYINEPWELFVSENKLGAKMKRLTSSLTDEFGEYDWRTPEIVTFEARDGEELYARLYRPQKPVSQGAAVVFVHGAGYKQNAHKWWSSYYREFMFHNFLVDNGYTVIDIDFRASRGYGRDWRTAIYRDMGGKDLTDQIDGAKYLIDNYDVDSSRIGIYGGSYGGFITLMAMFKSPGVFAAGAGLRSVTDWAHYNHGYTHAILNSPQLDSLAYLRSSPIYFAEGLEGALLMCHGMIDDNVHFQDVVRLSQRLIELGKDNWELAVYPLERHGFKEASSWTDEYKRVYKLFEENLNP